jgi:hypothetical protein
VRVQYFEELIAAEKKKTAVCRDDREIKRQPGNPMVRGHGTRKSEGDATPVPTPGADPVDQLGTQLRLV